MKGRLTKYKTKINALLLTAFASVCTLLVALTNLWTAPIIEQQKQLDVLNKLKQVLVTGKYDNNPLFQCVVVTDKSITGKDTSLPIYRATLNGEPYALIYQTSTQQGYNGLIELMVAIDGNGKVQGVRTLEHQETPGLGDKIELAKSDWILSFGQKSVKNKDDSRWFVKKDGGDFDQFTGATITPRAIVNQLRTSINAANSQFDALFSASNECVISQDNEQIVTNEVAND
jgi:electron transport complex protein RnfG